MNRVLLFSVITAFLFGSTQGESNRRLTPSRINWKSGLSQQCSKNEKLIDEEFIKSHEGFRLQGFVPCAEEEIEACEFGVLVGIGVDLGSKNRDFFEKLLDLAKPLDLSIINTISPYLGLKGKAAKEKNDAERVILTVDQELRLREVVFDAILKDFVDLYETNRDPATSKKFAEIPYAIRTAIFDFVYQNGASIDPMDFVTEAALLAKKVLESFITNDFKRLSKSLRSLGETSQSFRARRRDEADLVDSAIQDCDKTLDVMFLVDESGSIGKADFEKVKILITNFIKNFENKRTRVGIITYDNTPTVVHDLDYLQNSAEIIKDLEEHTYGAGGTKTGLAINFALGIINRSRRGDSEGISPNIFLLTDGQAEDDVVVPAKLAREQKVVITAIGIGPKINRKELEQVAFDPQHVIDFFDYDQLKCNMQKLKAEACFEQNLLRINQKVNSSVSSRQIEYFAFEVDKSKALVVTLKKSSSSNPIEMYVSTTEPNPDSIVKELWHSGTNSKEQIVTIDYKPPPKIELFAQGKAIGAMDSLEDWMNFLIEWSRKVERYFRRAFDDPSFDFSPPKKTYEGKNYTVFLGLKTQSEDGGPVPFELSTKTCDPSDSSCQRGTNDFDDDSGLSLKRIVIVLLCLLALGVILGTVLYKRSNDGDQADAYSAYREL